LACVLPNICRQAASRMMRRVSGSAAGLDGAVGAADTRRRIGGSDFACTTVDAAAAFFFAICPPQHLLKASFARV
jgi:hypothetical protein